MARPLARVAVPRTVLPEEPVLSVKVMVPLGLLLEATRATAVRGSDGLADGGGIVAGGMVRGSDGRIGAGDMIWVNAADEVLKFVVAE